jgi:hypothetical protein
MSVPEDRQGAAVSRSIAFSEECHAAIVPVPARNGALDSVGFPVALRFPVDAFVVSPACIGTNLGLSRFIHGFWHGSSFMQNYGVYH